MIVHPGESHSNAIRERLKTVTPRAQRTHTPSLPVIVRAKGSRLWTADGRRLVDMASGVLVANLGHRHTLFERLVKQYCRDLPRTSYNAVTPIEVEAAERLLRTMRDNPNAQRVLWAASGSEGIQKSLWAALRFNEGKEILVATRGGFHGKKGLAGDVSGDESANPNVKWISFPMDRGDSQDLHQRELDAIAAEYDGRVALLVTEPYLGARGSYHPPLWYHRMLEAWCRRRGVVFILDEVQSCHGRTGAMYAYQTYGISPDLVVLGKGLGNGEPVSAIVGRADVLDALDYGDASDTFSGNPRACAAVCATLDVFEQEAVLDQARASAVRLRHMLDALKDRFDFVHEVRGEGMVYGVEMADEHLANACVFEAYHGIGARGVHFLGPLAGKVLRVSPPLNTPANVLDEAQRTLKRCWKRVGT